MTNDYEDSKSTPEKLTLLLCITAVVTGNVSTDRRKRSPLH